MCTCVFVISLIIIASALGCHENYAKMRFYHNSMNNYTEMCMDEAEKILSTSWYYPERKTVLFCHGFTGYPDGPAIKSVVTAFLSQGKYNVALVNWEKQAAIALPGLVNSYIHWAVPNTMQLGRELGETMLRLSAAGLEMNSTHLVGHSLGAHMFGIAGYTTLQKGVQISCITALDPAIGFDMKPAFLRLSAKSARFVSVIHSDPHKYGSKKNLGLVDFWPNPNINGPVLQPGCTKNPPRFSDEEFCSHNWSWKLFTDTIMNPGTVLGSYAKNLRMWNRYSDEERKATVLEVGVCDENAVPGNYYFKTAATPPYGLGENGL